VAATAWSQVSLPAWRTTIAAAQSKFGPPIARHHAPALRIATGSPTIAVRATSLAAVTSAKTKDRTATRRNGTAVKSQS
jgi:hypothetical protein